MNQIISRTRYWVSLIRLKPFGTDTPEERSKERLRRVVITALVSLFAQGVSVLTVLISVPLTLNYLGAERYGLWVTVSSLIVILGFADLGIGNGLLNAVAEAYGRNDREAAKSYISSALFILTGVALFLGVIWFIVYPFIPWTWLFNVKTAQAIAETGPTILVFIICMLINIPGGLVQKIHDGYQDGYLNGLWRASSGVLSLACVLLAIHFQAGLPWLALAMTGSPVLILLINTTVLFGVQRPWLRPQWNRVTWIASQRILKNGSLFFVLQAAVAIGYQSDNLVIARFLGADKVPQYAVPMKLFMTIPSILNFVLAPLWPAYGEAIARQDVTWVRRMFSRSFLFSFGGSLFFSLFLLAFGGKIIEVWVGTEIQPDMVLLAGIGLWVILLGMAGPISILLNGANVIGFQVVCAVLMAVGNISLSIFLVQRIGVSGPVYGSVISWLIFSFLPSLYYIPRLFSSWRKIEVSDYRTV